jgi:diguanylate cyclase (GGDEF)-like protein/PAS domain S-box-containing protein
LVSYEIVVIVASVAAVCLLAAILVQRVLRKIGDQAQQLDAAINNMNQGLCMFDAQDRVVVWNRRYVEMYRIDPFRIWPGASIRDLLEARILAGTFPLDADSYEARLRVALQHGETFTITLELPDGRTIAGVNQPMPGGGWVATHEDITERTRADRELNRTRAFLDAVISNVPTPIAVKSVADMRFLLVNKAAEKFFGIAAHALLGKTPAEVFGPKIAEGVAAGDQEVLRLGKETFLDEHSITMPGGEMRIAATKRLPVAGEDGKPQYIITVFDDVTQRKRDEARISYMANHDSLTELPNRASFNECLKATLDLAGASSHSFAVLCMDVDRFKAINDTFSPAIGDILLRQLSNRLADACQGAFLARIGGDEFAVISPTGAQPATAEALADRLREAMAADFDIDGHPISAGISIGICIYPIDAEDVVGLMANAEAALYRAKSEERGSIRFFEPEMDKQLRDKRALQHDLRLALANGEIELYYQPQADIDGTITGFEALVRWHHPRQGMVPPSAFIPLAEESGLIMMLGEWILRTACNEAVSWPRPLRIAVNLSPMQFQRGELPNLVHEILLETGLSPARLELEITEGVLIGDFSRAMAILRRLKAMGVRIAMDDFGTGYSSLSYLQSFPFDKIKIDQVFIANLLHSPQSAAIVRAVIGLGQGLKLPVVAEGVETREQFDFLAKAACDGVQGYFIGRPQPIGHYARIVGHAVPAKERAALVN